MFYLYNYEALFVNLIALTSQGYISRILLYFITLSVKYIFHTIYGDVKKIMEEII